MVVATSKGVDVRRLRKNYEGSLSVDLQISWCSSTAHEAFYFSTHLAEEQPDVAIIHGSGNEIPCGKDRKI